jgi:hypothetical protein
MKRVQMRDWSELIHWQIILYVNKLENVSYKLDTRSFKNTAKQVYLNPVMSFLFPNKMLQYF